MAYKPGNWLAICDRCGMEFLSGQLKLTWDGLRVDAACWEPRHPQDFVRGVKEATIPWARPEPTDVEIGPFNYVENGYWDSPADITAGSGAILPSDSYVARGAEDSAY